MALKLPARRFDCGSHGVLTMEEAAVLAGCKPGTIAGRYYRGVRGDALAAPAVYVGSRPGRGCYRDGIPGTGSGAVAVAVRIALRFKGAAPDIRTLRREFGMHKSTAARWRRIWLDVLGQP